jgi:hypothetical protein
LACLSSRFSRSNAFSLSERSVGTPTRFPLSISDFFSHPFSVGAEQQIFAEIDAMVAHREPCSP